MSQQINLANPLLLKPRYAFCLREMAIGLGIVLAVTLAWAGYQGYWASVLETQAGQQEAIQAAAQQELDQLTAAAARTASPLLTERIQAVQLQVRQREELLKTISGILEETSEGFSPRLRALAHSSLDGVWLNGFTLSPDYVELKGSVLNAGLLTAYIDRLGKQAPFAGATFSGMTASQVVTQDKTAADADRKAQLPEHLDFTLHAGSRPDSHPLSGAQP